MEGTAGFELCTESVSEMSDLNLSEKSEDAEKLRGAGGRRGHNSQGSRALGPARTSDGRCGRSVWDLWDANGTIAIVQ